MGVYLRRDRLNPSGQVRQNRYFFVPAKTVTPNFPTAPIAPQLPGNDSTTVYGQGSPNFGFNIGRQQLTFQVTGDWIPLAPEDYPALPASAASYDVVVNAQGDTVFGALGTSDGSPFASITSPVRAYEVQDSATATATTARKNRQRFLEWVADQSLGGVAGKYANFRLGLHAWVNDAKWVEFKGLVTSATPGTSEGGGGFEQLPFTFTFLVCDTIEVTATGA